MSRDYPLPGTAPGTPVPSGLLFSVARLIRDRGYPPVEDGLDLNALSEALSGFLYGPANATAVAAGPAGEHVNGLEHPAWCSPEHCTAASNAGRVHCGTPRTIERRQAGQPTITLQVWQVADEPVDTAPRSLVLTVDDTLLTKSVHGYDIEPWQAAALVDELVPLVALLRGAR